MLVSFLKNLIRPPKTPVMDDALTLARDLQAGGQHAEAIKVLDALVEYQPDCVEALVLRGAVKRAAGDPEAGLADLESALAMDPDDAACLHELAVTAHLRGDDALALEHCARSRRAAPDFAPPRFLQAQIILGGESYMATLGRIHAYLSPRTYIEIGIFQGESLRLAKPPTIAIGVDPNPKLLVPPADNQRVFAETSDAFFAGHDLRTEFGDLPVDLAFIDGMHHFEYALRDFAHIERHCTRDSTILIHDCYPLDRETARRDGSPPFWSGDVWRLIVLLKKYRPDLAIHTIGAPPTGLGLVRRLDPESRFLSDNHDRLCEEFLALDYAYLDDDKPGKLNLVDNDWDKVRALLVAS